MKIDSHLLSLSRTWRGLLAVFVVLAVPAVFFAYMNRPMLAIVPLAVIPLLIIVTTPRWAAYLFVLTWGIFLPFKTGLLTVHLMDIGFVLLLTAVALEYLLKRETAIRKTGFDMVFWGLIVTATLSGIFAYRSTLSIVPILRIIVIYAAFRLLFKLATEMGIRRLLEFYLALTFLLSLATTAQLIFTGGSVRVFGPAHLGMQYFVMTGIPISLCFFIWSKSAGNRARYAVYALFMFVAMLATQSRAPLLTTAIAVPVLLVAAGRQLEAGSDINPRKNLRLVWVLVIAGALGVVAFGGSLFAGAIERTQDFITSLGQPRGTVALRLILWRAALDTFFAHPLLGIGIGNFRIIDEIMPQLEFAPLWQFVRGMSAHNVILHYLAETGIAGATALIALAVSGFRAGVGVYRSGAAPAERPVALALFISMFVFVISLIYLWAPTWGQGGYIMAFIFALTAAWRQQKGSPRA